MADELNVLRREIELKCLELESLKNQLAQKVIINKMHNFDFAGVLPRL